MKKTAVKKNFCFRIIYSVLCLEINDYKIKNYQET